MYKSSFESFEPRRLFSVFTQDLNYHPAGPFDACRRTSLSPRSARGRFLLATGTEDGPAGVCDGPNPITVISRVMADGSLDPTFGKKGQLAFDGSGQNVVFTGSRKFCSPKKPMRATTRDRSSPIPSTANPTSPSAAATGRRKSRSCRRTSTVGSTPRGRSSTSTTMAAC